MAGHVGFVARAHAPAALPGRVGEEIRIRVQAASVVAGLDR
ncbi:hypothetical protein ABIE45_004420 [Methylobacterium sp. OAE515]